MQVDFYDYIASENPFEARSLIESFGYQMQSRDIAASLRTLVNNEGEPALNKIMQMHPDREYLQNMGKLENKNMLNASGSSCGCSGHYSNASGGGASETAKMQFQTNTFLLVSALFIAAAIITTKS